MRITTKTKKQSKTFKLKDIVAMQIGRMECVRDARSMEPNYDGEEFAIECLRTINKYFAIEGEKITKQTVVEPTWKHFKESCNREWHALKAKNLFLRSYYYDSKGWLKLKVDSNTPKEVYDKIGLQSKEHIKHFLLSLNYPLFHFDFETFDTAVPIFDKSRPYQKIPFQYSLHIEQEEGSIEHKEYLAEGNSDPRLALLEQMKIDLAGTGDIIVFNKSFEISVMRKLAEDFPEHDEWLQKAIGRIVDLADVFRPFYYYNPSQKGSYSIKQVLPAITGKSYSELEINNGGDASMMYFYSHILSKLENKGEIRKNLLKYCCLDTEGMVWIVEKLRKL